MKATVLALAIVAGVLSSGCGKGNAILNIDVLSFLPGTDSAKAYNVPGGIPQADSTISRQFSLPPGFGSSTVDSVSATIASVLQNTTGGGNVTLQVFFARTQAALFMGTPYVTATSGAVSGLQTVNMGSSRISLSDTVFNAADVWVGIRARISTNAGPNMTGQLRLTNLSLRVVLQDKVF
jgi:hypothetical protein